MRLWDEGNSCENEDDSLKSHPRLYGRFGIKCYCLKSRFYLICCSIWNTVLLESMHLSTAPAEHQMQLFISHLLLYKNAQLGKDYMMFTTNLITTSVLLHTPVRQQTHFGFTHFRDASTKNCHSVRACVRACVHACVWYGMVWLQFRCSDHSIQNHSGLLRTDPTPH